MGTYQIETEDGTYEVEVADEPQQPQGFMAGLSGEGGSGIMSEIGQGFGRMWDGVTGIAENYQKDPIAQSMGVAGVPYSLLKQQFAGVNSLEEGIDRVGKTAASMLPVIGPAGYEMIKDVALGEEQPAYEYGKMFRQGVTDLPAQATAVLAPNIIKGGYNAGRGMYEGVRDFAVGKPQRLLLEEQATRPDAFASTLNYPSRRTPGERIMTENAAEAAPSFQRNNPVAGVDQSQPGAMQITQLQDNLDALEAARVNIRNDILPQVAQAENQALAAAQKAGTPYKVGVGFDDISESVPTQTGSYGLPQIAVRYGAEAVGKAQEFMRNLFGFQQAWPAAEGRPAAYNGGRALSIEEANIARQRIDGVIAEIGGYDDAYWASSSINPSTMKGYAEALRFYRNQLDGVVKNKITNLLGEDAARRFTQAGEDISMVKTYRPMIQRFSTETGEAFIPGSAKQMAPGEGSNRGYVKRAVDTLFPDRANKVMREKALTRESKAIDTLQQLVEIKNAGFQQPLPRSTARIKASLPNLQTFAGIATKLGILNASIDITKLPEPVLEKMVAAVAQAAPEMFETNPDNVNVVNNKLQNPMEVDMLKAQAVEKPTIERAMAMIALNKRDYTPYQTPMAAQMPAPVPELSQLSSLFDTPQQGASFVPRTDAEDNVAILERMTAIHERDIQ